MALLSRTLTIAPLLALLLLPQAGEYELKGELLARFADFVQFPDEAFDADDSPFVIGVIGDDPFGPILERATEGRNVAGRPLEVRRFRNLDDLQAFGTPQVLFVPASERANYGALFSILQDRPVLTVGEEPTFARDQGLVNLIVGNNRTELEIANDRAQDLGLTISSQLLRMAVILSIEEPTRRP